MNKQIDDTIQIHPLHDIVLARMPYLERIQKPTVGPREAFVDVSEAVHSISPGTTPDTKVVTLMPGTAPAEQEEYFHKDIFYISRMRLSPVPPVGALIVDKIPYTFTCEYGTFSDPMGQQWVRIRDVSAAKTRTMTYRELSVDKVHLSDEILEQLRQAQQ